jgi:hypothetical protein
MDRRSFLTGLLASAAVAPMVRAATYTMVMEPKIYDGFIGSYEGMIIRDAPTDRMTVQTVLRAADIARKNKIPPIIYEGQPHFLLAWSDEKKQYVFRANALLTTPSPPEPA